MIVFEGGRNCRSVQIQERGGETKLDCFSNLSIPEEEVSRQRGRRGEKDETDFHDGIVSCMAFAKLVPESNCRGGGDSSLF